MSDPKGTVPSERSERQRQQQRERIAAAEAAINHFEHELNGILQRLDNLNQEMYKLAFLMVVLAIFAVIRLYYALLM